MPTYSLTLRQTPQQLDGDIRGVGRKLEIPEVDNNWLYLEELSQNIQGFEYDAEKENIRIGLTDSVDTYATSSGVTQAYLEIVINGIPYKIKLEN